MRGLDGCRMEREDEFREHNNVHVHVVQYIWVLDVVYLIHHHEVVVVEHLRWIWVISSQHLHFKFTDCYNQDFFVNYIHCTSNFSRVSGVRISSTVSGWSLKCFSISFISCWCHELTICLTVFFTYLQKYFLLSHSFSLLSMYRIPSLSMPWKSNHKVSPSVFASANAGKYMFKMRVKTDSLFYYCISLYLRGNKLE